MTDRELMQQALDALETVFMPHHPAVIALRDRLVQSEQGPVAWQGVHDHTDLYYRKPPQADVRPLYINPPAQPSPVLQKAYRTSDAYTVGFEDGQATQRQWVGLTDEDKAGFWTADQMTIEEWDTLFNEIEEALKEKNT